MSVSPLEVVLKKNTEDWLNELCYTGHYNFLNSLPRLQLRRPYCVLDP